MKQSERTQQTKERIFAAATEEFGTYGYAASSLNNICAKYNIAKGLVYHNFSNKDTLYLSCVSRCFCAVTEYVKQESAGMDVEVYLRLRYRFFSEHPLYARIFFEAILQPPEKLKEQISALRRDIDTLNREVYHATLQKLTLRNGVSEARALAYFELMQEMFNGYFSSSAYASSDFSIVVTQHEQRLSEMLDLMLYGIATEGERT